MEPLVIVGAGGHAKVVIEVVEAQGLYRVAGLTSASPVHGSRICGYVLLGDDSALKNLRASGMKFAVPAVGDNRLRKQLSETLVEQGWTLPQVIHPSAVVSSRATVAPGAVVMPGAVINVDSRVGCGAIVNTGATIDHDCVIGDFVHIAPGVNLAGNVSIEEGAFVGVGSVALPRTRIGSWATIGAGSVIVRDVPPFATAYGVPCRVRRESLGN